MRSDFQLYDFFATPDDQDCLPKLLHYIRYSSTAGAILSVYEMLIISKPMTGNAIIGRFLHLSLPFVGAGAMYGATTCITAQLRNRDDCFNHIVGSFGALSVWVAKYNRMSMAFPYALMLATVMGYIKHMRKHKYQPFFNMVPKDKRRYNPFMDFSVKVYDDPGRPKDWQAE